MFLLINGIKVQVIAALAAEIGAACEKAGVRPHFIGVGPVEASVNLTRHFMKLQYENNLPDVIFSAGSAGSATLPQAELFQINAVSYRDMDASAFGFPVGQTPFSDFPARVELPVALPDFPCASLSTGGAVIAKNGEKGKNFSDLTEDAADMESYAKARVSAEFRIPFFGLRGISDGAENPDGIGTWEQYLGVIDEKIADYFKRLQAAPDEFTKIVKALKQNSPEIRQTLRREG